MSKEMYHLLTMLIDGSEWGRRNLCHKCDEDVVDEAVKQKVICISRSHKDGEAVYVITPKGKEAFNNYKPAI